MAMAVSSSSSWMQSCCCSFISSFTASINAKAHFTTGTSIPFLSLATSSTLGGRYGPTLRRDCSGLKSRAKFEKFDGVAPLDSPDEFPTASLDGQTAVEEIQEDDSCLPSDLVGAVRQSGEAAAAFVSSGGLRGIVELLIPQLTFLDDEGAQAELWELSRIFVDTLLEQTGCQRIKAVFPDTGAAALLKYRWKDAAFGFSSLSDRKPVEKEDEIVVMVVPDYQMLEYVERIASELSDDSFRSAYLSKYEPFRRNAGICDEIVVMVVPDYQMLEYVERIASELSDDSPRPLIMWNPRLVSEDVGVGFNVRKLRRYFLSTFTVVYSMRPFPAGAVFRCYPGPWKVFFDDKDRPNRYLLAKEMISRPDAEDLEIIFGNVEDKSESDKGPSFFDQAAGIFSSFNRFVKAISK